MSTVVYTVDMRRLLRGLVFRASAPGASRNLFSLGILSPGKEDSIQGDLADKKLRPPRTLL